MGPAVLIPVDELLGMFHADTHSEALAFISTGFPKRTSKGISGTVACGQNHLTGIRRSFPLISTPVIRPSLIKKSVPSYRW